MNSIGECVLGSPLFRHVVTATVSFAIACGFAASAGAAVGPVKAEVIYGSNGRIVSIKADGSDRKYLTRGRQARISPDGRRLVFLRAARRGGYLVMVSRRDGSDAKPVFYPGKWRKKVKPRLVRYSGVESPVWSAGGRIFLILQRDWYGRADVPDRPRTETVISMKADGSDRRRVMTRVHGANDYSESLAHVDVSPDGRHLLLGAFGFRGVSSPLERFDVRTGKTTLLRRHADGGRWSPNGRRILFQSDHEQLNMRCNNSEVCYYDSKIYTMDPDGSNLKRVTSNRVKGSESGAEWSPDGSRILFSSDRNDRYDGDRQYYDYYDAGEVYSVKPDGSCLAWLTNGNPGSYGASWGPEKNRDTSPGACGPSVRAPVVSRLPEPWRNSDGSPSPVKRIWLGPVYQSMLFSEDYGSESHYEDCGAWFVDDCGSPVTVYSERQCALKYYDRDGAMVKDGSFGRLSERRGALIMESESSPGYPTEKLVLTGKQVVAVEGGGIGFTPTDEADFAMIDALRPVGAGDATAPLEPGAVDQRLVDRASNISAVFETTHSVASTAEQLNTLPAVVRSFLRFHDEVERVGPATVNCPPTKGA